MNHKGIVGTTILMVLGWTVFVLGLAALFFAPLVGALLATAGAVQVGGGMITGPLSRKLGRSKYYKQQCGRNGSSACGVSNNFGFVVCTNH